MDDASLMLDIGLVLLLAAGLGWMARRIRLPAVLGYLAAGLAVSPFTPGYVAEQGPINLLANIGVVLLLFEVGIEIDLGRLRREQRSLLWMAPMQLALTTGVTAGVLLALGQPPYGALLVGLAVAMSSSVVIVNITRSRRRTTDRATEERMLAWSVVQDIAGVSAAAVVVATFGAGEGAGAGALVGLALFGVVAVVIARVLPAVLARIRTEHDTFLIVSVAAGVTAGAAGTVVFGIPTALAAFVAGLVISDRPDTAEARRRLLPFRDVFAVLFFVTVGSLIDPATLAGSLPLLVVLVGLVVVAKVVPIYVLARTTGFSRRPAQLATGLGQLGEFGFVLASLGVTAGAVDAALFSAVLGAITVTIAASAVLARRVGVPVGVAASRPEDARVT